MRCPRCNKTQMFPISGDYPTGVVAPDGYQETWYQEGYQCANCGTIVDEEDIAGAREVLGELMEGRG